MRTLPPNSLWSFLVLSLIFSSSIGCSTQGKPRQEDSQKQEQIDEDEKKRKLNLVDGTYVLNNEKSTLKWKGTDVMRVNQTGSLSFGGYSEIKIMEGKISKGSLYVDMHTIEPERLPQWARDKLRTELESPSFFDIKRFPNASIEILAVKQGETENHIANVAITIKGIRRFSSVPIVFEQLDQSTLRLVGSTEVDRTEYGIVHRMESTVDDMGAALSAINPRFTLNYEIVCETD
jgi:polyisoprenoid-binding protein YceI